MIFSFVIERFDATHVIVVRRWREDVEWGAVSGCRQSVVGVANAAISRYCASEGISHRIEEVEQDIGFEGGKEIGDAREMELEGMTDFQALQCEALSA